MHTLQPTAKSTATFTCRCCPILRHQVLTTNIIVSYVRCYKCCKGPCSPHGRYLFPAFYHFLFSFPFSFLISVLLLKINRNYISKSSAVTDIVVWWDADAVPLAFDSHSRIEKFLTKYPKGHIFLAADVSNVANTGLIIVRNTLWACKFLEEWLSYRNRFDTEQEGLAALLAAPAHSAIRQHLAQRLVIVSTSELNSIAPAFSKQQKNHMFLHLGTYVCACDWELAHMVKSTFSHCIFSFLILIFMLTKLRKRMLIVVRYSCEQQTRCVM